MKNYPSSCWIFIINKYYLGPQNCTPFSLKPRGNSWYTPFPSPLLKRKVAGLSDHLYFNCCYLMPSLPTNLFSSIIGLWMKEQNWFALSNLSGWRGEANIVIGSLDEIFKERDELFKEKRQCTHLVESRIVSKDRKIWISTVNNGWN